MRIEQKCSCGAELTVVAAIDRYSEEVMYPSELKEARSQLEAWFRRHEDCGRNAAPRSE